MKFSVFCKLLEMNLSIIIKKVLRLFIRPIEIYSPVYTLGESDLLKNKNVVITGGGSGIGRATAILASKKGANVVIIGRTEQSLKETISQCSGKCKYYVCDLTTEDYSQMFSKLENILGSPINVLVNNAGIYVNKDMLSYTKEDFEITFSLNTSTVLFLTKAFIQYCKQNNNKGNIVVTSSNRSLMGDVGPYGMSKSAVNNFIQGYARELVPFGIRCNGVAPGMTASNINQISVSGNLYNGGSRGKRVLLPDEIAEVICFLASDISKCITGAIIPCDEGDFLR